ncbi:hypothetical protein PGUG_02977 [Meyerozyma guilliermondii ATCC 6260]|uniref:Uncharacterized protein n=1 Tax=Meyerozyma guilliermondii (strain ATCC 6260 / CBS 566 / DSM 6381 / JCM 1539 / NBRC 10279 / NRRL Y-324) TaxID=294746 RepID=A5DI76_PICGU|nr:uncharacterized protein PGUG_02977 [Meyerozyma guilliermondii ATCC 6260]EDK38880.1 hypothetical protein PGUG_02977 [Meyerozyma guilliermondii ATCC 6260]
MLNMRYVGSDTHLLIPKNEHYDAADSFVQRHKSEFGFTLDRMVLVDDVQVILVVKGRDKETCNPFEEVKSIETQKTNSSASHKSVYFESKGWIETAIYKLKDLVKGNLVHGPAIILDETQTIVIEPFSFATILKSHVLISIEQGSAPELSANVVDPIQLSVFGHRFMSIAEQMGRTLQQTASFYQY